MFSIESSDEIIEYINFTLFFNSKSNKTQTIKHWGLLDVATKSWINNNVLG